MAATRDIKTWLVVFALCMVLTMQLQNLRVCAEPQVPCFFSFGDSLADNGNNNELATSAKVNYLPYGIDFSDGPTGRFTNGRNTVDILVELFGFEKGIPSYATANGSTSLNGVNYASGTSGIIAASGKHLGDNIHLAKQIINHRITISRIVEVLGNKMATERLNKCLYWVAIGNSDYVHNYYFPGTFYPYRRRYDTEEFADFVIGNYLRHIKKLYSLGARKIVLVGLGKVGCTPYAIS
ncbi:hypothetical protein TIFTF001_012631 [Ficus carica]|uniref:GDSL esterase/lipase n=1 Tax=Ficus carica TaxID=3494 RepID=A0AA88DI41_FICCA|nr:hypothetical protein TIFTF001_012631 [Ficus carica]